MTELHCYFWSFPFLANSASSLLTIKFPSSVEILFLNFCILPLLCPKRLSAGMGILEIVAHLWVCVYTLSLLRKTNLYIKCIVSRLHTTPPPPPAFFPPSTIFSRKTSLILILALFLSILPFNYPFFYRTNLSFEDVPCSTYLFKNLHLQIRNCCWRFENCWCPVVEMINSIV